MAQKMTSTNSQRCQQGGMRRFLCAAMGMPMCCMCRTMMMCMAIAPPLRAV